MNTRTAREVSTVVVQSYLDRLLAEVSCPDVHLAPTPSPGPCSDEATRSTAIGGRRVPIPPARDERGEWCTKPFQALLFRVHEVRFAAPLIHLHGVVPWNDIVANLPGTADWFLGVHRCRGRNVRVVDTARLVLQGQNIDVDNRPGHVVLLDEERWGMTCDSLSEVLNVSPTAVQWRKRDASRPWLAGMLRDKLCALLDIDALVAMLADRAG